MAVEIYYDKIVTKGEYNNKYYEQKYKDRAEMAKHFTRVMGIVMYRQEAWQDVRDWKMFRSEMMDEVKWGKGQHGWKPSIDDMLWKLMQTGTDDKYGQPSRFSVKQVENFNKYCSIIAKIWNTYHKQDLMTANELQVKLTCNIEEPKQPLTTFNKFVEVGHAIQEK